MRSQPKIVLVRHASPEVDESACGSVQARQRLAEYNETTRIAQRELHDFSLRQIFGDDELRSLKLLSSTTPRALETAKRLRPRAEVSIDDSTLYTEFDLRIPQLPWVKLSLGQWFFVARLLWLVGFRYGARPRRTEHARAMDVTERLEAYSQTHEAVVLVAHGLLNRVVGKQLRRTGWTPQRWTKRGRFTVDVFVRTVPLDRTPTLDASTSSE